MAGGKEKTREKNEKSERKAAEGRPECELVQGDGGVLVRGARTGSRLCRKDLALFAPIVPPFAETLKLLSKVGDIHNRPMTSCDRRDASAIFCRGRVKRDT